MNTQAIYKLYESLLDTWNKRDAEGFAELFDDKGNVIGFDGSQMNTRSGIEAELKDVFIKYKTAPFYGKVQEIRFVPGRSDIVPVTAILRAIVGVPKLIEGKDEFGSELNPKNNSIQTMVARLDLHTDEWKIELFQNTPAQFHGRPELVASMSRELQELLDSSRT